MSLCGRAAGEAGGRFARGTCVAIAPGMSIQHLVLGTLVSVVVGGLAGCDSAAGPPATCDHDGCVIPLTEVTVCGPTLHAATTDCPGTTVETGTCGTVTHVKITTVNPIHDCYYTTSSGQLVGAVVRSDSGFTKVAGTVPTQPCPASTQVCQMI
jgi:hypothetical protein